MSGRAQAAAGLLAVMCFLAGCSGPTTRPLPNSLPDASAKTASSAATTAAMTANVQPDRVIVAFDAPGADPRPLREVPVVLRVATTTLAMTVTDLSYRGLVCGFTFTGTRPASPVTITVSGSTKTTPFTSGPVPISWSADGAVQTGQPQSDNGWSFSADAYPNRNGPGWAVSVGAVTGEGADVIPTKATCRLSSSHPFVEANGPVGYWAGFATR